MSPLGLYIHFPWCEKKCPYCDFNSHTACGNIPQQAYTTRVIEDFISSWELYRSQSFPDATDCIHTVFIGGGTPSLWEPACLAQVLDAIQPYLLPHAEITMEANPSSSEASRFAHYRAIGVNRLSLGVQSFDNRHLSKLGRIHDQEGAHRALEAIVQAGFARWNVDLMFGLPGQSVQGALDDLQQALQYNPPHVSWYQLTVEPQTAFYRHPPVLPDSDLRYEMQQAGISLLQSFGLERYEISAFAQLAQGPCLHNVNYWEFGDYLGVGAGAHSKYGVSGYPERVFRIAKQKAPVRYLDAAYPFIAHQERVSPADYALEFCMNVLRLKQGVPKAYWEERTGLPWSALAQSLTPLAQEGWLADFPERVQCSENGWNFLDTLLMRI